MPPVVKMVVCSSPCQRPSGPQLTPSITCRHAWCKCCRCVLGHLISARISFKRVSHMCRCSSVGAHAALKALTRAALQGQTCAQAHMSQAAGLPAVCVPCGEFRPVCVPLGQPLDWLRAYVPAPVCMEVHAHPPGPSETCGDLQGAGQRRWPLPGPLPASIIASTNWRPLMVALSQTARPAGRTGTWPPLRAPTALSPGCCSKGAT